MDDNRRRARGSILPAQAFPSHGMAPSESFFRSRGRHVLLIVAAAGALAVGLPRGVDRTARDRATALARALHERGITAKPEDVQWVDPPHGVWGALGRSSRAIVRAVPPQ